MTFVRDYRALISGQSWNGAGVAHRPVFVTYSFERQPQDYLDAYGVPQPFLNSFENFTRLEKSLARRALDAWGEACGITFLEASPGKGDIRFGNYDLTRDGTSAEDVLAYAYYPYVGLDERASGELDLGGDVFVDRKVVRADPQLQYFVLLHEIGHAIGLKHPFEGKLKLPPALDSAANTVMTYSDLGLELGRLDRVAARHLYGAPDRDGDQVARWTWLPGSDTLRQWGTERADVIKGVSGADLILAGKGGDLVSGSFGDDRIEGGRGDDVLFGGYGDDILVGGPGKDRLSGGEGFNDPADGSDTVDFGGVGRPIEVRLGGFTVEEGGREVTYHTRGAGIGLDTLSSIENVVGGRGDDLIAGKRGANLLEGRFGRDELRGGLGDDTLSGGIGEDALTGGAGADRFVFDARLRAHNADTITDFLPGRDLIVLAANRFTGLEKDGLAPGAFRIGAAAQDAEDRMIYDADTGILSYDRDGSGGRAPVVVARLDPGLALRFDDFEIV